MSPELDEQLCEKYPKIFRDRHADPRTTCMCWGFEHGDGWYKILDEMCAKLQNYLDTYPNIEQVVAIQVKEKFGTLRFYYSGGDDACDRMIQKAEEKSERTCEITGEPGRLMVKNGWYKTVSDKYALEEGYVLDSVETR